MTTEFENDLYHLVTLTKLTRAEILSLLDRVKARVEALPTAEVKEEIHSCSE